METGDVSDVTFVLHFGCDVQPIFSYGAFDVLRQTRSSEKFPVDSGFTEHPRAKEIT